MNSHEQREQAIKDAGNASIKNYEAALLKMSRDELLAQCYLLMDKRECDFLKDDDLLNTCNEKWKERLELMNRQGYFQSSDDVPTSPGDWVARKSLESQPKQSSSEPSA